MYEYNAMIVRVVDGDTVHLDVDLGFYVTLHDRSCRIAHINAPELGTDEGKAAKTFAAGILYPGLKVILKSHSLLDKYGRLLGSIESVEGQDFGQIMIEKGHAVPYED